MREKYESLALATLKELAKSRGIKGVSTMKKEEVVEAMLALDEKEKSEKSTALNALEAMQKAEKARRVNEVKEAIKKHLSEIKDNTGANIADNECDDLMTDEKLDEYAECEDKDGKFCGTEKACKDVDAKCMSKIIETSKQKNNAQKNQFAWNKAKNNTAKTDENGIDALINKYD